MSTNPRKRRAFGSIRTRAGREGHYLRFEWRGREYQVRGGKTYKAAADNLSKIQALLLAGEPPDRALAKVAGYFYGPALTFREVVDKYLVNAKGRKRESTLREDTTRLRAIQRTRWSGNRLGAVTSADLMAWAEERRGEVSCATVNRDLAIVSAVFRWAIRAGHVEENPAQRVERYSEKGRAREVYLTSGEASALLKACAPSLRPVVLAALHTGMRRGELLALRWRAVDLVRREILVEAETEKAGRGRVIPMTEALAAELAALHEARDRKAIDAAGHVFTRQGGKPIREEALRTWFRAAIARCAPKEGEPEESAGIPLAKRGRVTFHTLRHSCASLLVAAGVPLFDVAKILGHSTLAVTMRYAHFAPEAGRSAVVLLGKALGGAPVPEPAKGAKSG